MRTCCPAPDRRRLQPRQSLGFSCRWFLLCTRIALASNANNTEAIFIFLSIPASRAIASNRSHSAMAASYIAYASGSIARPDGIRSVSILSRSTLITGGATDGRGLGEAP